MDGRDKPDHDKPCPERQVATLVAQRRDDHDDAAGGDVDLGHGIVGEGDKLGLAGAGEAHLEQIAGAVVVHGRRSRPTGLPSASTAARPIRSAW